MADQFGSIGEQHKEFIEQQKVFFVATAAPSSRVNLSPKGGDCFRVVDPNRVVWLNLTGSGNETAAHVPIDPRITVMFCSFEKSPMILRLYGKARVIHPRDEDWGRFATLVADRTGARQFIEMAVDLVQTSCGFGVPRYDFLERRPTLDKYLNKSGNDKILEFWEKRNQESIDGLPTYILHDGE